MPRTPEHNRIVLEQARAWGLLGDRKDTRIAGRVSSRLVEAAKARVGVATDSELIEMALATLALEDDFGKKLVARKGSISKDIDLEF